MCTIASLLLTTLLGFAPAAQLQGPGVPGSRKVEAVGVVRDAAGRAVAGAHVLLWSWPLPARSDVGDPHEVRVRTRADGRFVAGILPGRAYSAYAHWRTEASATRRTAVVDGVVPGPACLLHEAPAGGIDAVEIRGMGWWHREGPLRVTVAVGHRNPLLVPLQVDGKGRAVLPETLPPGATWIDVRTASGRLLRASRLPTAAGPDAAPARTHLVTVPAVQRCRMRVVGPGGAPVAGALVHQMHDYGYYGENGSGRVLAPDVIGATDASGELLLRVPAEHPVEGGQPRILLLVSAEDHQRHTVDLMLQSSLDNSRLTATLRAGSNLRGRFVDSAGRPITSGLTPLFDSFADTGSRHPTTGFCPLPPMPLALSQDGSFVGPGIHQAAGVRLFVVVAPELAARLGLGGDAARGGTPPVLPVTMEAKVPAEGRDLGDIRLDEFQVMHVVVRDHHGVPVPAARLRVRCDTMFAPAVDFVADRVGRLWMPLPDGVFQVGAYVPRGGVASWQITVERDKQRGVEPVVLTLSEAVTVRGVVGGGGESEGARVALASLDLVPRELVPLVHAAFGDGRAGPDGAFEVQVSLPDANYTLRAMNGEGAGEGVWVPVRNGVCAEVKLPRPAPQSAADLGR